jgi:hypothetical protein
MISDFQRQSRRRKLIYIGLILVLFGCALGMQRAITPRAKQLEIREQDLGDVDLTDQALRLTLTGSRGVAICALWYTANQKQEKHEWNELELIIRSLIKLQPHFETPWLFQSWNLAYNVSAEVDRVNDKYFHITRGIRLLADGSRKNHDNATLRYSVGFYDQDKIGLADQKNALRSLFQLSCIDPLDREPSRFRQDVDGKKVIDLDKFEKFAVNHPFLVKRLRDRLRCNKPEDVVRFLEENQKVPGRFEDPVENPGEDAQRASRLKSKSERFPPLPDAQKFNPNEITDDSDLADDFDNYCAARTWYGFSQDPINAGKTRRSGMHVALFQGYPARAQAYYGENLEDEGWFDETGWEISDWFPRDPAQPRAGTRPVTVGKGRAWAMDAWERAYHMYLDYGQTARIRVRDPKSLSDAERKSYDRLRMITNIEAHVAKADVERQKKAITARRSFYEADRLRKHADRELALRTYERPEAFPAWKEILIDNPVFGADEDVQEDTYIMQRKYLALTLDKRVPLYRKLLLWQEWLATGSILQPGAQCALPPRLLMPALRVAIRGPFDDVRNKAGRPLIAPGSKQAVIDRLNLAPEYDLAPPRLPQLPQGVDIRRRSTGTTTPP